MKVYLTVWLSVRRYELMLVLASGVLAALLWNLSVPDFFPRPALPPERVAQLFAALVPTVAVAVLRPVDTLLEETALVSLPARRLVVVGIAGVGTAGVVLAGVAVMSSAVGGEYARNAGLHAALLLCTVPLVGLRALVLPWLVTSACFIAGYRTIPGRGAELRTWALPLHPADQGVGVVIVGLLIGSALFVARGVRVLEVRD